MSARRPPSAKAQQQAAHAWNKTHGVGTSVFVTLDDGTRRATQTESEAWVLGGHTAVIVLDGICGAYSLARVEARV